MRRRALSSHPEPAATSKTASGSGTSDAKTQESDRHEWPSGRPRCLQGQTIHGTTLLLNVRAKRRGLGQAVSSVRPSVGAFDGVSDQQRASASERNTTKHGKHQLIIRRFLVRAQFEEPRNPRVRAYVGTFISGPCALLSTSDGRCESPTEPSSTGPACINDQNFGLDVHARRHRADACRWPA